MKKEELLCWVKNLSLVGDIVKSEFVGSRVSCNPPPTNTDCDILCLINITDVWHFNSESQKSGWVTESNAYDNLADFNNVQAQQFWSFRKDDINLIVTSSIEFYDKFMFATKIATNLNLKKKIDRIILFQAILYGKVGDGQTQPG